jgi:hypothetical protein
MTDDILDYWMTLYWPQKLNILWELDRFVKELFVPMTLSYIEGKFSLQLLQGNVSVSNAW